LPQGGNEVADGKVTLIRRGRRPREIAEPCAGADVRGGGNRKPGGERSGALPYACEMVAPYPCTAGTKAMVMSTCNFPRKPFSGAFAVRADEMAGDLRLAAAVHWLFARPGVPGTRGAGGRADRIDFYPGAAREGVDAFAVT